MARTLRSSELIVTCFDAGTEGALVQGALVQGALVQGALVQGALVQGSACLALSCRLWMCGGRVSSGGCRRAGFIRRLSAGGFRRAVVGGRILSGWCRRAGFLRRVSAGGGRVPRILCPARILHGRTMCRFYLPLRLSWARCRFYERLVGQLSNFV